MPQKVKSAAPAYWWAMKYVLFFKSWIVLIIAASLCLSVIGMVLPNLLHLFTDRLITGTATGQLLGTMVAAFGLALLVQTAIQGGLNRWKTTLSQQAMRKLHGHMFRQLRRLGIAYSESKPSGEVLSLYHNEVQATQSLFTSYFPSTIGNVIFLLISFTYLCSLHWVLACSILPFFLSYYLIGPHFERKAAWLSKEQAEKASLLNQQIYNSVSSLLEARYMNADEWDHRQVNERQEAFIQTSYKQNFNAYMRGTVRRLSIAFGSVFIFFLGAWYVQHHALTVGGFIAFIYLYFTVIGRLTILVTDLTEQKVISQQIVRLYDFFREVPAVQEAAKPRRPPVIRGELRVERVSFSYAAQPERGIVRELSLHIHSGEKVAFVGPSGSGKSTLLKLLGRLYDPDHGTIYLDGMPLQQIAMANLREAVGYVFQETYLFPGSIRDNIRFGKLDATEEEIEAAAEAAFALGFIRELPDGFDTEIGERGFRLSGGQRQRIAIARVFIKNPALVFLDEATSALDNVSEQEVQKALLRLLEGRTTVTIAHRLSTVLHADRIFVIKDGGVAEEGTYAALMARGGIFYQLVSQGSLSDAAEVDSERSEVG